MLGRKTNSEYLVQNIVKEIKFTVDYLNGYYPYLGINRLFLIGDQTRIRATGRFEICRGVSRNFT